MDRTILHSDCNSFYVSVELISHPEYRDLPVSVGGDAEHRHGIILSSNQAAKKYGVKTGEALWQAKRKCRDLIILPPHHDVYARYSRMMHEIYLSYTDQVEPFGLDEAWLDVTGSMDLCGDGMKIAEEIRQRAKHELGITVSVGVSFNKAFAKAGSDYKKPDAITEIDRENFREILYPLSVRDLLFVGGSTERKLNSLGVYTIGELADMPIEILRAHFGKLGDMLHFYSNGMDDSPVSRYGELPPVKSVGNSTTPSRDLKCFEDVKIVLISLAESVSERARKQGLKGRVISIGVRNASLNWFSRQKKLDHATNLSSEIIDVALELFKNNYSWKEPIRSIGVSLNDLDCSQECVQVSIFGNDNARQKKRERLEETIDSLRERFGVSTLQAAVMLTDKDLSGVHAEKHGRIESLPK